MHKFQPIQSYDQQLDVFEEHEEHQGGFLKISRFSLVENFYQSDWKSSKVLKTQTLANGGLFDQVKEVSDPV